MSFLISNQRDVVKQLQYVAEDSTTTPGNWGTTPATPSFTQAGYNPTFTYTDQPEGVDIRILGNEGKTSKVKVGLTGLLELRTHIVNSTLAKWFFNAAGGGSGTIDDSFSFIYSHNVLGTETLRILRGCIPLNASLEVPNRGPIELSGQVLVTQPADETTTIDASFTGSPSYASQPSGPVWTHLDGGDQALTIGGNTYRDRGFTLNITRELSQLDSSGSNNPLFAKAARKVITGTATVFRIDSTNQSRSTGLNEMSASRVLKTGTSTVTLTNFQIQNHATEYDSGSSDALMESLGFECTEVSIS